MYLSYDENQCCIRKKLQNRQYVDILTQEKFWVHLESKLPPEIQNFDLNPQKY